MARKNYTVEQIIVKLREVELHCKAYVNLSQSAYKFGSQKYAADGAVDRFIELINR